MSILTQFLSNRSQHVMVDGCRSKLVNVVSGVLQDNVLGRYCSSCTLRCSFPFWKISRSVMLMTTLMAVVPSPGVRVTVAEFLIGDLGRVSEWCDLWGMKLNASKTKTMIVCKVTHNASPVTTINY